MKKHGLRIAVFILSFAVGIGFVAILNLTIFQGSASENDAKAKTERTDSKQSVSANDSIAVIDGTEDIKIKFKKFVDTERGLAVDFVIINSGSDIYIYNAFSNGENSAQTLTLTELKIDGEKIDEWRCQNGLMQKELKSGETKKLRYLFDDLIDRWEKGRSIEIGLNLRKKTVKSYQTFWSENLPISDSIAEKLLEEQTQREKEKGFR